MEDCEKQACICSLLPNMAEERHFFWSWEAKTQIQKHGLHLQKLGLNSKELAVMSWLNWGKKCISFFTRFITFYFSVAQERVHRKRRGHSFSHTWDFKSYFKAARLCYLISFKKKKKRLILYFCGLFGLVFFLLSINLWDHIDNFTITWSFF